VLLVLIATIGLLTLARLFPLESGQVHLTRTPADKLRMAAMMWRGMHAAEKCPTLQALRDDRLLDPASNGTDAWGTPFQIACTSDETIVTSLGPDKQPSSDDIVTPSPDGSP
jgi:hypothetical protein